MSKFGVRGLAAASDLLSFHSFALGRVQELRLRLKASRPSLLRLHLIDEISNQVSSVADLAAAVVQLHPTPAYRDTAQSVLQEMAETMRELNSDPWFYWSLVELKFDPVFHLLTREQQRFTERLMKDFEREGSHLPREKQMQKVAIQAQIGALEEEFLSNIKQSRTEVTFNYEELDSLPTALRPERQGGMYAQQFSVVLPLADIVKVLGNAKHESVRNRLFLALMTACPGNEEVLTQLAQARGALASVLGYSSYTDLFMSHQLFPQPRAEAIFSACYPHILPKLHNELGILADSKARLEQEDRSNPTVLRPWDIPFYSKRFLARLREHSVPRIAKALESSKYFTLGNVLAGMTLVMRETMGVEMRVKACPSVETWSNDIVKVEMWERGEHLGVLYLDLFQRPGKQHTSASKLNVRCSKQKSTTSSRQQRPISVLVCAYSSVVGSKLAPDLGELLEAELDYEEAKELFHEFGHAVHALASKTEFQCFSGTRVPLDFAEFPSHLFELFLTDYDYVKQWAVNKSTKQPISLTLFQSLMSAKYVFRAIEHQSLLLRALFDLQLHSNTLAPGQIHASLMQAFPNQLYSLPDSKETHWYRSFEHLAEYGGSYYTYIIGQVLAETVWNKLYHRKTINKEAGIRLLRLILQAGGEASGAEMVGELLQAEQIKGETGLQYAFSFDLWAEIETWYQHFARDDELVAIETLRAADTWRDIGSRLPTN